MAYVGGDLQRAIIFAAMAGIVRQLDVQGVQHVSDRLYGTVESRHVPDLQVVPVPFYIQRQVSDAEMPQFPDAVDQGARYLSAGIRTCESHGHLMLRLQDGCQVFFHFAGIQAGRSRVYIRSFVHHRRELLRRRALRRICTHSAQYLRGGYILAYSVDDEWRKKHWRVNFHLFLSKSLKNNYF